MKILPTSGLHLSRQFNGIPREGDHGSILCQIACAFTEHSVDTLTEEALEVQNRTWDVSWYHNRWSSYFLSLQTVKL